MANKSDNADRCNARCGHGVMTTAVIGPRGQIVIPKEAREWMNINPGDQIVLMSKMPGMMVMLRAESFRKMATHILDRIK
jgi:AbrB family looped-hinge helix DNA binding protein